MKNPRKIRFEDGEGIMVSTEEEPVAWQGPIVMNSREELWLAFEEYHNGIFIKHQAP